MNEKEILLLHDTPTYYNILAYIAIAYVRVWADSAALWKSHPAAATITSCHWSLLYFSLSVFSAVTFTRTHKFLVPILN